MITYGFTLLKAQHIAELNLDARLFRHDKSGAELLSLENNDENKVFGITFRTPPPDSSGIAHIMEHAVLCGSRKYPVKEPFVELVKGSLKTFLNAMTFPDKTSYPVASQNLKDFYNLVDVYLDAVLYPRLTPYIFQQEGWHYDLQQPDEPVRFKGVVFNEMKGAYSSPNSLLYRHSKRSLFPESPYGQDSGGDPEEIPDLTYAQFKAFHKTYYHPSNACIFFYGDDDPEERLRVLDSYLRDFEAITVSSEIPLQPPFDHPQELYIPYDSGAENSTSKKAMVTFNWLLSEVTDPQTTLALNILSHILVGTPASPLRKALIDSGLGSDMAGGGLQTDLRQMYFSTGLKGTAVEHVARVKDLIIQTLRSLVQDGIETDMVAASLNTVEFRLRENNTGSYPRGLALMFRALSTWLYDGDPLAPLAFEAPLQAIKTHVAEGTRYFEELIQHVLLTNPHRSRVVLQPEPGIREQQEAAERQRLEEAQANMDQKDLERVIHNTRELQRWQDTPDSPEALAKIPTLTLDDLAPANTLIPREVLNDSAPQVLYHDMFTNGILYLELGLNLHLLPPELLPYLPLFGQALVKIGTEQEDFVTFSRRIGRQTGGIYSSLFASSVHQASEAATWLFLHGKCTCNHAEEMLAIFRDMLLSVKLDNPERFRQLALEAKARKESSLIPAGHSFANKRLGAHFTESGWVAEQFGGVSSLFFLRTLLQNLEHNWPQVLEKLEQIHSLLLNRNAMICNVTVDRENWQVFQPRLDAFLKELPAYLSESHSWHKQKLQFPRHEGLTIPARVNYVTKGANIYAAGYQLHGSVAVILNYLRSTWLWEQIRVRGGAYGGSCLFDQVSGVFGYFSYRDPNLLNTLNIFDRSHEFLENLALSESELTRNIIGAIGRMDAYQLPDAKGYTSLVRYLIGDTDEKRQQLREEILSTRPVDLRAFADVLRQVSEQGQVVVLGAQDAIEQANEARNNWLSIQPVL